MIVGYTQDDELRGARAEVRHRGKLWFSAAPAFINAEVVKALNSSAEPRKRFGQ